MSVNRPEASQKSFREIIPTTPPITTLDSPTARSFVHIHPFLILGYFYFRFPQTVASPVSTLYFDIAPIVVIQCAYAITCLPVNRRSSSISDTSSSLVSMSKSSKLRSSKASSNPNGTSSATRNALLSLLLTLIAAVPTYFLLVLFGAPITTHHPHTFLAAGHFALLALFPLFYVHGVDKQAWWEIGGALLPFDAIWGASVGTALGAWLGAIPIPLDWDRDWQEWPITIVAGMYGGAAVGSAIGRTLLQGKRMDFSQASNVEQEPVVDEHKQTQ